MYTNPSGLYTIKPTFSPTPEALLSRVVVKLAMILD
jgi:hypothetical protein